MSGQEIKIALVDGFVKRMISRKFLVFIIATIAFFSSDLSQENWTYIAMIYIGIQGVADLPRLKFEVNQKP